MARDPSEDELILLRSLLRASGSRAQLERWIDLAEDSLSVSKPRRGPGRPRGPKYSESDRNLILLAEELVQAGGCTPTSAIKRVADRYWRPELALSRQALVSRLLGRLVPKRHRVDDEILLEFWPARFSFCENLAITRALSAARQKRSSSSKQVVRNIPSAS
jgi:hypothetical protein